jgi:uncharacterized protein (TIGR00266 family)
MKHEIFGNNLPAIKFIMEKGDGIYCESGAMSWMDPSIKMITESGGFGKMLGRALTNESLFRNHYVANDTGELVIAANLPGSIEVVTLEKGESIIVQKGSYLASSESVEMSTYIQKKISGGFFGGEGFIMQKFTGPGQVFIEIAGSPKTYELEAGQKKIIDTGYLVMMDESCDFDIQTIKGVKNVVFGGEGLFNTVVTGPGKIILQTMPVVKMAEMLSLYMPSKG